MPLLLSKGALAIAAVVVIALNARGGPIRSKTLARRFALPERHLEPMLQAMARHGILKSRRGPLGGYELARDAASRPIEIARHRRNRQNGQNAGPSVCTAQQRRHVSGGAS
jgi:Rrf2 family protein